MTEPSRPSPDALLAALQSDAAQGKRGRLKVFLGMCPGVGKTYAMLEAAQRELKAGRDLIVGYVETHGRTETSALVTGLTITPRKQIEYRGIMIEEMDIDAVLTRRPQLALVDELAHTNTPGSRHPKRWQDVQELLDAGIDVFTTCNVQHIESRADTVRQITGAEIRETVPDSVLDTAEIELIDLPPAELLQRMGEGKVYVPERATAAAKNFFRESNLTALRELALRLVADHVGEETQEFHRTQSDSGPWKTGHRLLVAVSASPFSEPLIRWTRRMADSLKCPWMAVHVESSRVPGEDEKARLEKNLALARTLGAEVIATSDEDLARGLLRIARQQNISQIVVGKPNASNWLEWLRAGRLLRQLTRDSGNIDLHVVRAEKTGAPETKSPRRWLPQSGWQQYATVLGVIAGVALLNVIVDPSFSAPRVPGLIFLLTVVLLALFLGRGPVLLAGALSALVWNYFFLPPRHTFVIGSMEDAILFGLYFAVAIVLGQLVARIRAQELAERHREERAAALYQLSRELAQAGTRDEVVWQLTGEVNRIFRTPAAILLPGKTGLAAHPDSPLPLTEKELNVAEWAYRHRQAAGRFTDNLPGAEALHLPLATERAVLGVLSVNPPDRTLSLSQRDLLEAYARQAALVLDRIALRAAAEQSKLVAESERLSNALLNSISHELRTPLAAITSATNSLVDAKNGELQRAMVGEIQEAAARLNRLVGNLLDVTRLESGHVQAKLEWCDIGDIIQTTVRALDRELAARTVKLEVAKLPLARLDFTLMQQALSNLLLNAVMHTPPRTAILVQAYADGKDVVLRVSDDGPGLPADLAPRVFDKFVRAPNAPPGGSGLGLAIVKGFVEAQGGRITAENKLSGGAVFTIRLPQSEAPPPLPNLA
ncbi:MAG TPA: sensor histidine kinase KdpD [Verrucomicrobiae bacterium]|jgi:two-component system sensor histidine kinase KdpD|nr:sensor histidine kinase KdpD [Verrucomicrobiae bacterium]